ncbi:hypothetical protein B0T24DRAFT_55808 [Lasiosphaeria ovina]|uniref:DUF803 domain-containing protein n=1 Tax=Lasiosphaeria ovina TaxID=92902 RepID=A0AAE0NL93_9PEZI|nr:hypothetical protein B0T24DRAFT_55808 [Lasiosphaeria ovina]
MGLIGGISPGGSIALGIVVGLLSTSVQSLGLTLQRKSHILEDEKGPYDVRRPPYRRRRWQLGMGMFVISNVLGSSIQISMLPLPVLSTLQASGLVFNSICATLILGEPFTRWSLWGTMLVCGGAVLIAIFGAIPSPAHKLSELLDLLGRRPFVLWMSFQAVIVIAIAVATEFAGRFTALANDSRFRLARGFAYGCISGILSAHSLLVAKSAVELLVKTIIDGDNQFVHWQSWMLVIGLVTLALTQLYYLHRGLKLVSTSVLYPLIFCIYNIIAILDGLIYFRQTDLISPLHACLITLGTVILLSGVLALSWRLSDEQHAPGVGQSTLAPGLGLVDDTDGEEEEEDLLLRSDIGEEEDVPPTTQYSYQTFGPARSGDMTGEAHPQPQRKRSIAPPTRRSSSRWTERAEIWDELEDRDTPTSPSSIRRRSTTLPSNDSMPLLFPKRGLSDFPGLTQGDPSAGTDQLNTALRQNFQRRRKSTGFPGFTARKTGTRKSSGGLRDAVSGLWRLRWWRNKDQQQHGNAGLAREPFVRSPAVGTLASSATAVSRNEQPAMTRERPEPAAAADGRDMVMSSRNEPSRPSLRQAPVSGRERRGSGGSSRSRSNDDDSPV